jgi:hypothetical protein
MISTLVDAEESYVSNDRAFVLDLAQRRWRVG